MVSTPERSHIHFQGNNTIDSRGEPRVEHHDPRVYDEMHRGSRSATRHMPGGHPGPVGHEGSPAKSILRNGPSGRNGQIQFVVVFTDGTISKYPSRYDLRIENCMLKDENDDGICEPGEHIMAQNIMVRNYGMSDSRLRNTGIEQK